MPYSDWHFHYCEENLPHRIDYNSTFSYDIPLYMYLQKLDFLKFNSFRLVEKKYPWKLNLVALIVQFDFF